MTPRHVLCSLAAAVLIAAGLGACGSDSASNEAKSSAATPGTGGYGPAAAVAVKAVSGGAALLDVRRQDEWDAGHARGARRFELSRIERGELPRLDKSAKIFVYCRTGRRAAIAVRIMKAAGFTDVTNIGGLSDWQQAGGSLA